MVTMATWSPLFRRRIEAIPEYTQCIVMAVNHSQQDNVFGFLAIAGRFVNSFIFMGISKTLGVLMPSFIEHFDSVEGTIAVVFSLFAGLPHCTGILTTHLVKSFGVRSVMAFGGIFTFIGLLIAALSSSLTIAGIGFAIAGIANGLCLIAGIMPITWYFPNQFAVMNGITLAGGAIGMMVLPPATEKLLDWYGFRGTMFLLASLSANCIPAAFAIKKPKWLKTDDNQTYDIIPSSMSMDESNHSSCIDSVRSFANHIINYTDFRVYIAYPHLLELQLAFMISGLGLLAWVIFLVPDAIEKGINLFDASLLSTVGGVGHIFGRVLQGPIVDCNVIKETHLFCIASLLCSISFFVNHWLDVYSFIATSAFNVGFATGLQYVLCLSMTKTTVGRKDLLLSAMGWTHLFVGIGKLVGGPLTGYLRDETGGYFASFLTLGTLEMVSIMLLLRTDLNDLVCAS